jgi:hypothetical protein
VDLRGLPAGTTVDGAGRVVLPQPSSSTSPASELVASSGSGGGGSGSAPGGMPGGLVERHAPVMMDRHGWRVYSCMATTTAADFKRSCKMG